MPATPTASADPPVGLPPGVVLLGGSYGSLAVARSMGRHGVPVCLVSAGQSLTRHSRYVTDRIDWAGPGGPDALDVLMALGRPGGKQGWVLLPGGDAEVQLVARNFEALSGSFRMAGMPWRALEPLNDKAQLYRLADRLGIAFPMVHEDASTGPVSPASMRFPVVIKPASTERSNALTRDKAWRAENANDYARLHASAVDLMGAGGFVVQELVPGDGRTQYSYAALWRHGEEIAALTARRTRQYPLQFGTSPFVETLEVPRVLEESRRLLAAVGYHGLVEIEFKHDTRTNQFKILDVNTRIWAWIGLGVAAGLDFPWLAALMASGVDFDPPPPPRYGPSWVHPIRNMLSVGESLMRTGHPGFAAGRALLRPSVSATGAWDDPAPGLLEVPVQLVRRFARGRAGGR